MLHVVTHQWKLQFYHVVLVGLWSNMPKFFWKNKLPISQERLTWFCWFLACNYLHPDKYPWRYKNMSIWLYVIIMSWMWFKVNLHSISHLYPMIYFILFEIIEYKWFLQMVLAIFVTPMLMFRWKWWNNIIEIYYLF